MKSFKSFLEVRKKSESFVLHIFGLKPVIFPSYEDMVQSTRESDGYLIEPNGSGYYDVRFEDGSGESLGVAYSVNTPAPQS